MVGHAHAHGRRASPHVHGAGLRRACAIDARARRRLPARAASHCVDGPAVRQVAVDEVVRAGLVGHHVRPRIAARASDELRQQLGGVAEQRRPRSARSASRATMRQRLVDVGRLVVEIAGAQAQVDARLLALDDDAATRPASMAASGCAPPMPPSPAVRIHLAAPVAAVVLASELDEGLVGALHDALRADVDPRAGGHLAVHHQALAIELVEVLPGRPLAAPGSNWRSARAAHRRGCGTRRPACPTAPAASRRRRAARSASTIASKHGQLRAALPMPP